MNERDHINQKVLAIIEAALGVEKATRPKDDGIEGRSFHAVAERACDELFVALGVHVAAGRPILAPRTKAILEAVEDKLKECEEKCDPMACDTDNGLPDLNDDGREIECTFKKIRRAAKGE